jgi:hypothetical protein
MQTNMIARPPLLVEAAAYRMAAPADDLPAAAGQAGNVFPDRSATNVAWYLPAFAPADDPDTAFSLAAAQSGVDASGNPFNRAVLRLGIKKIQPPDVVAYAAKNPSMQLREIPLIDLSATLTTVATSAQTGAAQSTAVGATLAPGAGGDFILTVPALLGSAVIVTYENLKNGGAVLTLTATYSVWRTAVVRPIGWNPVAHPPAGPFPGEIPHPVQPIRRVPVMQLAQPVHDMQPIAAPPVATIGSEAVQAFSSAIPLGTTYAGAAYASAYTITDTSGTHAIVSAADLTSYQQPQSEFIAFTALGEVAQTYPSFAALYIGLLSRTIVAVPARYGIVRSSAGTAATCAALLDSAAGSSNACTFEFSFVLGPVVSPIELLQLTADLAANPASHDCSVTLPAQLDARVAPAVATPFQTAVSCFAGTQPQTFALSVNIADAPGSPAVANANLFIEQLTASVQPYLVGRFGIKLDDAFPQPIDVAAVLNFAVTSGSDDVRWSIDAASETLTLSNASPLDLTIGRYAIASGASIDVTASSQALPAHASANLGAVAGLAGAAPASVLVDRTLALESPLTKAAMTRYLALQVQDVQAVQYQIGVLAGGIGFAARGIASLTVVVTCDDLPQISIPALTLTALDQSAGATLQLPVQYALTALNATVACTVHGPAQQPPVTFTRTNDFIASPVLVLADGDIPGFPATP